MCHSTSSCRNTTPLVLKHAKKFLLSSHLFKPGGKKLLLSAAAHLLWACWCTAARLVYPGRRFRGRFASVLAQWFGADQLLRWVQVGRSYAHESSLRARPVMLRSAAVVSCHPYCSISLCCTWLLACLLVHKTTRPLHWMLPCSFPSLES